MTLIANIPKYMSGKRCGEHSFSQERHYRLIVEKAFEYGHVVRFKGGNPPTPPCCFWKASEEIEYVDLFGIQSWVQGLTSAIAVPASQGITVNAKRGISKLAFG